MHLEEWLESNWKWSPRPSIKIKAAQQKAISSQGGAACGGPEQQVGAAGKQPGEAAKQAAAQQRQPVSDEKVAADALLGLVRQSPDGRVVASRLCSELYKECPGAKSIITRYGGLKNFTASPMLAHVVQYEADERAGPGSVVLKLPGGAGGKQPGLEQKPMSNSGVGGGGAGGVTTASELANKLACLAMTAKEQVEAAQAKAQAEVQRVAARRAEIEAELAARKKEKENLQGAAQQRQQALSEFRQPAAASFTNPPGVSGVINTQNMLNAISSQVLNALSSQLLAITSSEALLNQARTNLSGENFQDARELCLQARQILREYLGLDDKPSSSPSRQLGTCVRICNAQQYNGMVGFIEEAIEKGSDQQAVLIKRFRVRTLTPPPISIIVPENLLEDPLAALRRLENEIKKEELWNKKKPAVAKSEALLDEARENLSRENFQAARALCSQVRQGESGLFMTFPSCGAFVRICNAREYNGVVGMIEEALVQESNQQATLTKRFRVRILAPQPISIIVPENLLEDPLAALRRLETEIKEKGNREEQRRIALQQMALRKKEEKERQALARSESLRDKAHEFLAAHDFQGARSCIAEAIRNLHEVGLGNKPFSKQEKGAWVRICNTKKHFGVGSIEEVNIESTDQQGKLCKCICVRTLLSELSILVQSHQVEDPLADFKRLELDIAKQEKMAQAAARQRKQEEEWLKERQRLERAAELKQFEEECKRRDQIVEGDSLLAKARAELLSGNFTGARLLCKKADQVLRQVEPVEKPLSKKLGTWVRVLNAYDGDPYHEATGIIIEVNVKGSYARQGVARDLVVIQLDEPTCGYYQLELEFSQLEHPFWVIRRVEADIEHGERLDKEKKEREKDAILSVERNILQNLQSDEPGFAARLFGDAIDKVSLDSTTIKKLARRFKEQKQNRGLGVDLSRQRVRTLINDDRPLFLTLIPCLSNASLQDALQFVANKSRIDFSGYKEYWPLLKPLLQALPTAGMSELPVLAAIEHRDEETLALLLQAGADPNWERGDMNLSSLHAAIGQGEDFVRPLLEAKADCNLQLKKEAGKGADLWRGNSTPLHQACMILDASTSQRMVALLLEHGNVDFSIQNRQKKTALDIAQHKSVKEMLTRSQQDRKMSKKKKSSQNDAAGKPAASSHTSQQRTEPELSSNLPADAPQTKSKDEPASAKPALTIEERLLALQSCLEQKAPCVTGIAAQSKENIGKNDDAEMTNDDAGVTNDDAEVTNDDAEVTPSSGALAANMPCSQNNGATAQARESEDEKVQVAPFSDKRDEVDDALEATEDGSVAAMTKTPESALDLRFSSQAPWDLRFTREFKEQLFMLFGRQPVLFKSLVGNLNWIVAGYTLTHKYTRTHARTHTHTW